jgi:RNA ligase
MIDVIDIYDPVKREEFIKYATHNPRLIRIDRRGSLAKFNYTQKTHSVNIWNKYTVVARGLVIDMERNEVVIHPFNKFFNEFEYKNKSISIPFHLKYWITEKMDGVLIIPYQYKEKIDFSTRGKFENTYIDKARKVATFDTLPEGYTYMFELVSPTFSQHDDLGLVTNYEKDSLVLIGMRDNETHTLVNPEKVVEFAEKNDLDHFKIFQNTYEEISKLKHIMNGNTLEGWVIFFENNFLMKIKRMEYVELFKTIRHINRKQILRKLRDCLFYEFLHRVPEELRKDVLEIYEGIQKEKEAFFNMVRKQIAEIPEELKKDTQRYYEYVRDKYPQTYYYYLSLKKGYNIEKIENKYYRDKINEMRKDE